MYPIQYQQLIGKSTTPIITDTNTPPTDTETSDTSESGDTIQTDTTNDGLFANASTDQTHGSALEETTDFNAFEDLNEVIDTGFDEEATKTKLQEYISQGKKLRVIAQKSNDTESKKYSLFLWKKATTLLDEIENGTEINTDDINQQMAQFSEYLNKLTSNEETPVPETKPEPTPTPEEFF
ncbi:TPA: hypothetical protein DEP21_00810 [Patescibacteria group bacterium]|nr:hypothetical protein [Candidatus Gracilibacteria bacterium]